MTGGADGSLVLRHMTSEGTLLRFAGAGQPTEIALVTPRADGILVKRGAEVERYSLDNPHPEFSWRALFGKVWYEGYHAPEYVWQSTGATDDFEPKLSLVPLVFGTIKGTLYALLFAMPLAVFGALYTSQFVHPRIKARVKPTVEIMAALPSVVIGFIAGLWLASRVEGHLVPVLLLLVLLPLFGTSGVLLWDRLPQGLRRSLRPGTEIALIVPLLLVGGLVAFQIGPWIEAGAFGGDLKAWLTRALGLVYDQRNSIVVGLAMGFAVIPIIFTISEDAFSSVPSHLTAASLALGASRWQTATRVVLPTASPGIFSAIMVGFGRAVGETMIVLMATGNTPVLDWSPLNGMRTLSANIAVEMPEAPHGGTLYRVLFLSALRAVPDDVLRQHHRRAGPPAPAREVPGDLTMELRKAFARGDHLVWLTGSALGMCLVMILGMLLVILANGLGIFWPAPLEQLKLKDGSLLAGELTQRQTIPDPDRPDRVLKHRVQLKVGNRDLYGIDFRWVDEDQIAERSRPRGLYLVERSEYGPLIGTPVRVMEGDKQAASGSAVASLLPGLVAKAARDRRAMKAIEKDEIGEVNYALERIRLERRKLDYRQKQDPARDFAPERQALDERETKHKAAYAELEEKLAKQMELGRQGADRVRERRRPVEGAARARRLPRLSRQRPGLVRPRLGLR